MAEHEQISTKDLEFSQRHLFNGRLSWKQEEIDTDLDMLKVPLNSQPKAEETLSVHENQLSFDGLKKVTRASEIK